jgi:FtsP/CotA-like multicopper oxidase with cupredoxin domain
MAELYVLLRVLPACRLIIIAQDAVLIEPVEVGSLQISPGEVPLMKGQ